MAGSLQDQLLKAGLVDRKKIEQAQKERRRQAAAKKQKSRKKRAGTAAAKPAPTPEQLEKQARDRELEAQRAEVRRQREVAAQVRQLVRDNRIPRPEQDDNIPFHFENKGRVKRLMVSAELHRNISNGKLVIVNDNGMFELVPPKVAEKIRKRNPALVIELPEEKRPDENDPYAEFQVPDDLMW